MSYYQCRKSHCGDKTILRPSYFHNGTSYTGKMISLYWIRALLPVHTCEQNFYWIGTQYTTVSLRGGSNLGLFTWFLSLFCTHTGLSSCRLLQPSYWFKWRILWGGELLSNCDLRKEREVYLAVKLFLFYAGNFGFVFNGTNLNPTVALDGSWELFH